MVGLGREDVIASGKTFDVVADTVGATSFARSRRALAENGRFLSIGGGLPDVLAMLWAPMRGSRRVVAGPAEERPEDLRRLAELAEAGALRPVIDRRYDFAQIAEAHAYVGSGRKRGNVVVRVTHED